ncbi:hypothetical protein SLNHY_3467 [Streptomyces albus]|nr:hypothetical protein SLNHY_3467 [Streptomyces albus]
MVMRLSSVGLPGPRRPPWSAGKEISSGRGGGRGALGREALGETSAARCPRCPRRDVLGREGDP